MAIIFGYSSANLDIWAYFSWKLRHNTYNPLYMHSSKELLVAKCLKRPVNSGLFYLYEKQLFSSWWLYHLHVTAYWLVTLLRILNYHNLYFWVQCIRNIVEEVRVKVSKCSEDLKSIFWRKILVLFREYLFHTTKKE